MTGRPYPAPSRCGEGYGRCGCRVAWTTTFADPRLCAAIVDRCTFGANILETGTDSCRLAHTQARLNEPAQGSELTSICTNSTCRFSLVTSGSTSNMPRGHPDRSTRTRNEGADSTGRRNTS